MEIPNISMFGGGMTNPLLNRQRLGFGTGLHMPKLNIQGAQGIDKAEALTKSSELSPLSARRKSSDVEKIFDSLYDESASKDILKYLQKEDSTIFSDYVSHFAAGGGASLNEYDAQKMVYTISAKYVALQQSIEDSELSNQEKQELQAKLDKQLDSGLSELQQHYGKAAEKLFSSLGSPSNGQKAASALVDLVQNQIKEYQDFMASDEGKTALNDAKLAAQQAGTSLGDGGITQMLVMQEAQKRYDEEQKQQELAKEKLASGKNLPADAAKDKAEADKAKEAKEKNYADNTFTLNDLQSLGDLSNALSTFVNLDPNKSEEQIGYEFGLGLVKAQEAIKQHKGSEFLSSLVTSGYQHFMDENIKQRNQSLQSKQEQNEEFSEQNQNPNAYKLLDASKVQSAFNKVMNSYNVTGNASEAVISGFESVKLSFNANFAANSSTIRYQNSSNFFNNFYSSNNKIGDTPYETGRSDYQRYMNKMDNRFPY